MASLVTSLAIWNSLPNANITCLLGRRDYLITGLSDGLIWIYAVHTDSNQTVNITHKILLIGHKASVRALEILSVNSDGPAGIENVLISASEEGEIIKWNLSDGQCLSVNPKGFPGVPTSLKVFCSESSTFILCSGRINEIYILDANSLEVVRIWSGHDSWVTCAPILYPATGQYRILTSSTEGRLNVWSFDPLSKSVSKDKSFRGDTFKGFSENEDQILELIVGGEKHFIITLITDTRVVFCTLHNLSYLHVEDTVFAPRGSKWGGGAFLSDSSVLLHTQTGDILQYRIDHSVSGDIFQYKFVLFRQYHWSEDESVTPIKTTIFQRNPGTWISISVDNSPATPCFVGSILGDFEALNTEIESVNLSEERSFESLWPLKTNPSEPSITVSAMIEESQLAVGYDNGEIHIISIAMALVGDLEKMNCRICKGHSGRISCLFAPDTKNIGRKYLVSGSIDCTVRIWDIEDGEQIAVFALHSRDVIDLISVPESAGRGMKNCILSIGGDNSVAIVSLDDMSCLYFFGGQPYTLTSLQWRPAEDYLILAYADGSSYVWQIQSVHLDRIMTGAVAAEIMNDVKYVVSFVGSEEYRFNNPKQTIAIYSIRPSKHKVSCIQLVLINAKYLLNQIHEGNLTMPELEENNGEDDDDDDDELTHRRHDRNVSLSSNVTALSSQSGMESKVIQAVISCLMSWGTDAGVDEICERYLGLRRPVRNLTFGTRGANGNVSILAPSFGEQEYWKLSPTLSASRLLSIVALTRSFLSVRGLEAQSTDLLTHYGTLLPDKIGEGFSFPSFSFLSKFWLDTSVDIQQASRSLFSGAATRMGTEGQRAVIAYWAPLLPVSASPSNTPPQLMSRAVLILGILGADHAEVLPANVRKNVALSLTLVLSDESKTSSRIAALELMARGFSIWEPYLKAGEVLRTLFTFANDADPSNVAISRKAKSAIFQIAAINTPLFVSTLTYDLINAKKPADRNGNLKIISLFVRKRPALLYSSLPRLIEAVVKTLDPNTQSIRELVLQNATATLHDLVQTYPNVDFHSGSQKLAVGTFEGASIIYDMRTATRWIVLEGHTKPVTCISFSHDGKIVVSSSLGDSTFRVWHPNSGFLGILGGGKMLSSVQAPIKTFSFSVGEIDAANIPIQVILEKVWFKWVSDRSVQLYVKDMILTFNV